MCLTGWRGFAWQSRPPTVWLTSMQASQRCHSEAKSSRSCIPTAQSIFIQLHLSSPEPGEPGASRSSNGTPGPITVSRSMRSMRRLIRYFVPALLHRLGVIMALFLCRRSNKPKYKNLVACQSSGTVSAQSPTKSRIRFTSWSPRILRLFDTARRSHQRC